MMAGEFPSGDELKSRETINQRLMRAKCIGGKIGEEDLDQGTYRVSRWERGSCPPLKPLPKPTEPVGW